MPATLDQRIGNKINSLRKYGVGMSFEVAYREYKMRRDTQAKFYQRACHWLLIERLCKGWV